MVVVSIETTINKVVVVLTEVADKAQIETIKEEDLIEVDKVLTEITTTIVQATTEEMIKK